MLRRTDTGRGGGDELKIPLRSEELQLLEWTAQYEGGEDIIAWARQTLMSHARACKVQSSRPPRQLVGCDTVEKLGIDPSETTDSIPIRRLDALLVQKKGEGSDC